jgi:hypothetical protein
VSCVEFAQKQSVLKIDFFVCPEISHTKKNRKIEIGKKKYLYK